MFGVLSFVSFGVFLFWYCSSIICGFSAFPSDIAGFPIASASSHIAPLEDVIYPSEKRFASAGSLQRHPQNNKQNQQVANVAPTH